MTEPIDNDDSQPKPSIFQSIGVGIFLLIGGPATLWFLLVTLESVSSFYAFAAGHAKLGLLGALLPLSLVVLIGSTIYTLWRSRKANIELLPTIESAKSLGLQLPKEIVRAKSIWLRLHQKGVVLAALLPVILLAVLVYSTVMVSVMMHLTEIGYVESESLCAQARLTFAILLTFNAGALSLWLRTWSDRLKLQRRLSLNLADKISQAQLEALESSSQGAVPQDRKNTSPGSESTKQPVSQISPSPVASDNDSEMSGGSIQLNREAEEVPIKPTQT